MSRRRSHGYTFVAYKGDHPPVHVYIYRGGREIGRWNIEGQRPMDNFEVGRSLRKALMKLGYLLEAGDG